MREPTQNKRGKESDNLLLGTAIMYPGLSQYELAKKLNWQSGKVDGAIRRLVNQKLIIIKRLERNGRTANLIYPKDTLYPRNTKPSDAIEVPANFLQVENEEWANIAFVYALDSATIGIAGHEMPEWKEIAPFSEEIPIKRQEGKMIFKVSEKFSRFYKLEKRHETVSVNGNTILIAITGKIIEEKKYPS